jgi:uncharacterized protein Usg
MISSIMNPADAGSYRLTTAEITYFLPDYHNLLQTYIWQEYDFQPDFPHLKHFIKFWHLELEGELHSVRVIIGNSLVIPKFKLARSLDEF